MNNSGIYSISFGTDIYIGSASHLQKRKNAHLHGLRYAKHHNVIMQRLYDKYKEDNFQFKVLLICNKNNLLFYEQLMIDKLKPKLNISKDATSPMLGRKHSTETKLKMSNAVRKPFKLLKKRCNSSDETKRKIQIANSIKVQCLETNEIFESARDASLWCISNGLTKSPNSRININKAAQGTIPSAYGFHWKHIKE